ncbi:MAG: hypothetical protein R3A52_09530 [Polyangiales bacterium]
MGGTGCVDNEISFFIRQVQAPVPMGASTCTIPADPSANRIFEGTLDVGLRDDYRMAPLLVSQVAARADMQMNRPETSVISVEGFVIEIHEGSPTGRSSVGPLRCTSRRRSSRRWRGSSRTASPSSR